MSLKALVKQRQEQEKLRVAHPNRRNAQLFKGSSATPGATPAQHIPLKALCQAKKGATARATGAQLEPKKTRNFAPSKTPQSCAGLRTQKALQLLHKMIARCRENLRAGGYPETQARVQVIKWVDQCERQGIPAAVTKQLIDAGQVTGQHGFVTPTEEASKNPLPAEDDQPALDNVTPIAEARLRRAASGLNIPIDELLHWYQHDLALIADIRSLPDETLLAYIRDYQKRRGTL